ncbi:hypothetical protein EYF80_022429 [Liparis tanakae]|uniref:Secreted protein n=1 Tax=Liparis tanakae TaxID=230148 RepID=A0A4Z2HRB3_9TELE|nr:hypothetical protein EYF80_022429 [Liparis tanakae]
MCRPWGPLGLVARGLWLCSLVTAHVAWQPAFLCLSPHNAVQTPFPPADSVASLRRCGLGVLVAGRGGEWSGGNWGEGRGSPLPVSPLCAHMPGSHRKQHSMKTHDFVLAQASEEPVQLPDGHRHQLVVGEVTVGAGQPVVAAVLVVRTEDLVVVVVVLRVRRRAAHVVFDIRLLAVAAVDALHVGVTRESRVVLDRLVEVAVPFVFSLEMGRLVSVGHGWVSLLRRGADEGLHCVLGCQPEGLRVHLLRVTPVVGYPELVAPGVISLLARVEVWR